MSDLFAPQPTDNLLPYGGALYDLGQLDIESLADSINHADLYHSLLTTLPWQSDIVTLFGKTHITNRQIVWMGDAGLSYRYSGHTHQASDWHPLVHHIRQLIENKIDALAISDKRPDFNACLLNYYPSGQDGMGYHADDEKELGDEPLIATLSLGATRKMLFRPKHADNKKHQYQHSEHKKTQDKVDLYLASGHLIVMACCTQHYWKHSIAKTTTVHAGRISLTFRSMLSG